MTKQNLRLIALGTLSGVATIIPFILSLVSIYESIKKRNLKQKILISLFISIVVVAFIMYELEFFKSEKKKKDYDQAIKRVDKCAKLFPNFRRAAKCDVGSGNGIDLYKECENQEDYCKTAEDKCIKYGLISPFCEIWQRTLDFSRVTVDGSFLT